MKWAQCFPGKYFMLSQFCLKTIISTIWGKKKKPLTLYKARKKLVHTKPWFYLKLGGWGCVRVGVTMKTKWQQPQRRMEKKRTRCSYAYVFRICPYWVPFKFVVLSISTFLNPKWHFLMLSLLYNLYNFDWFSNQNFRLIMGRVSWQLTNLMHYKMPLHKCQHVASLL